MIKRKPGFLNLAKQNAKRQGMYQVPKRYQPQGGEEEYPAFVTQKEMTLLKQQGGKGHMTPYGIPSFGRGGLGRDKKGKTPKERKQERERRHDPGEDTVKKYKHVTGQHATTASLSGTFNPALVKPWYEERFGKIGSDENAKERFDDFQKK